MSDVITLQGGPEVIGALRQVSKFDAEAAAGRVVGVMMPGVKKRTRVRYGILQAAWVQQGSYFINSMPYAVAQEFGTVYVDPTLAIFKEGLDQPQAVLDAFSLEIMSEARQAGFDT